MRLQCHQIKKNSFRVFLYCKSENERRRENTALLQEIYFEIDTMKIKKIYLTILESTAEVFQWAYIIM